jgi:hypothetical protein
VIVIDTSALVGAQHAHYLPTSFSGFWAFLDEGLTSGRLLIPRAVFDELADQSDGAYAWVKEREAQVVDPIEEVQATVGELVTKYRFRDGGDEADPFVIAEAMHRGFAVATYEGRTPTGNVAKSKAHLDNIPFICKAVGVGCLQPAAAWEVAGLSL